MIRPIKFRTYPSVCCKSQLYSGRTISKILLTCNQKVQKDQIIKLQIFQKKSSLFFFVTTLSTKIWWYVSKITANTISLPFPTSIKLSYRFYRSKLKNNNINANTNKNIGPKEIPLFFLSFSIIHFLNHFIIFVYWIGINSIL